MLKVILAALALAALSPYREPYRPRFHFSPRRHWTNDPCGIVFADGQYHLFFQFNPFGDVWGHMSWGHAVSPNLVNWTEQPVAIPEDPHGMIFTGSSVVDAANTSQLCENGRPCIVSIFTGHTFKTATAPQRQNQNLAVSQDGKVWQKYKGNPVLDRQLADFRDPKVFWHAPSNRWVMVLALPAEHKVQIYGSKNLKQWEHLSDFGPEGAAGGEWECPDLYQLPIDGDRNNTRWVLKIGLNPGHLAGGSGEQYFVGQFDGQQFRNENPKDKTLWLDYGRDCYCALTFNNTPDRLKPSMIGWMDNWQYAGNTPTAPWRGQMTAPRTLSLRNTPDGPRLAQQPVESLQALRMQPLSYTGNSLPELNRKLAQWAPGAQALEAVVNMRPGSARSLTWKFFEGPGEYTLLGYDAGAHMLFVDRTQSAHSRFNSHFPSRTTAPLGALAGPLQLHILVDRSSIEVFAQQGTVTLTNLVYANPQSTGISLEATSGEATGGEATSGQPEMLDVKMWKLRSSWEPTP
jgi:fructan beta-fructosidase